MLTQPGGDPRRPTVWSVLVGVVGIVLIFTLIALWWVLPSRATGSPAGPTGSCIEMGCGPSVKIFIRHWFRDRIQLRCHACRRILTPGEASDADVRWSQRAVDHE